MKKKKNHIMGYKGMLKCIRIESASSDYKRIKLEVSNKYIYFPTADIIPA
jgi:hypothetical protein